MVMRKPMPARATDGSKGRTCKAGKGMLCPLSAQDSPKDEGLKGKQGWPEMEDWKQAHDKAKEYIAALEENKDFLRDEAIKLARERDEWERAYREAMRPTVIL